MKKMSILILIGTFSLCLLGCKTSPVIYGLDTVERIIISQQPFDLRVQDGY